MAAYFPMFGPSDSSSVPAFIPKDSPLPLTDRIPGITLKKGDACTIPVKTVDANGTMYKVRLLRVIAEGAEGLVFETSIRGKVVKVFKRESLTRLREKKVKALMGGHLFRRGICFPQAAVYNTSGDFVGYLMDESEGIELRRLLTAKVMRRAHPAWTRRELLKLCNAVLDSFVYLHDHGILVGDVSTRNILVKDEHSVCFVDTDSYQIGNLPCTVGTPEFTAPELQGRGFSQVLRTKESENFSVAALMFEILMLGKAPYAAVGGGTPADNILSGEFAYGCDSARIPAGPWAIIWDHLYSKVRQLFIQTFSHGGTNYEPAARLDAFALKKPFRQYLNALDRMAKQDPEALAIFPRRMRSRQCKVCGAWFTPVPDAGSFTRCPSCEAKRRMGTSLPHESVVFAMKLG